LQILNILIFDISRCDKLEKTDDSLTYVLKSNQPIQSFAKLENGYIASGSIGGFIKIWNVQEGTLVGTLKSPNSFIIKTLTALKSAF